MGMKTVTLYSDGNISSFSCDFGEFKAEADGSIEIPELLIPTALVHGFRREKEKPKPKAEIEKAPVTPKSRAQQSLEAYDRFDLIEYCKDIGLEIPPRMTTPDLRKFILEKTAK